MEQLNWVDYVILGIIALSAIISLLRGFAREALSLAAWVVAFWIAFTFSSDLSGLFESTVSSPSLRLGLAFGLLFLVALLLGALINFLVGQLIDKTGLTGTDRLLGAVFGVARGALLVTVLVMVAGLTVLPQESWWQGSQLVQHFQELAVWLRGYLPPDIADRFVWQAT